MLHSVVEAIFYYIVLFILFTDFVSSSHHTRFVVEDSVGKIDLRGVPFLSVNRQDYECQNGPKRYPATKTQQVGCKS